MPDLPEFKLKISTQNQTQEGDEKLKNVETAFSETFHARRKTITILKTAALLLDDISKVQKGLEVGGGVVSIAGKTVKFINHIMYGGKNQIYVHKVLEQTGGR
jgi:hypothetical protein